MSKLKTLLRNAEAEAAKEVADTPFSSLFKSGNYDYYFERGQIVPGEVIAYQKDGVLVDVGAKSEAFVPMKEVSDYAISDPSEALPIGQEFEFYILRDEAGSGFDGRIVLSYKRVSQARSWALLEEKRNTDEIFEARIQEVVKGGVVVEINGLRGFIPASHLRVKGGSNNPKLVGEKIPCTILEIDKQLSKLILSQKLAISKLYSGEREKLLSGLVTSLREQEEAISRGETITPVTIKGEVVRITDFGAFVKIEDTEIDGLLPLSEISWKRVSHPSEALQIGDPITAQVLNVVPEQCRISLSLKRLQKDPWELIQDKIHEGQVITGSVNKVANFGVFIKLLFNDPDLDDCGFEALLPLDEIENAAEDAGDEVLERFQVGQKLKALIRKIKVDERRVTLSTKYIDQNGNIVQPLPEDLQGGKKDNSDSNE